MGRPGRRALPSGHSRAFASACAALPLALGPGFAPARADTATLQEIVVRAQKRPEKLGRVPMALSLLTASDLEAAGIRSISDLAARSPMLDLEESVTAATTTLRVRGIGNLGNIPTFEPAVGLFVDGAFRSRSLFASGSLLDVERIELLRGPQTALYGKNVGAGVVAIYTREPGEQLGASVEAGGGSMDVAGKPTLGWLMGSASGPIGKSLRGGIAVGGRWHGDLARNALAGGPNGNNESSVSMRGQLLASPVENLTWRLIAGYLGRDDDEGESDVVFVPGSRSADLVKALQQQGLAGTCPDNRAHDRVSCSVATNHLDLDATDATLIADYRLENGWTLHSITGYEHYRDRRDEDDAAQYLAPILFFHDSEKATALQEEIRLASADDARVSWLAGAFWYTNDYERGSRGHRPMFGPNGDLAFDPFWLAAIGLPFATPGQEGLHDSRLDTDHVAGFGEITLPLANRFDVTAAARWAREEKHASIENSVTVPGVSVISRVLTPDVTATGEPVNGSLKRASEDFTWSLTPRYDLGPGGMLYATWTRGGKFGGFNTGFGNAPLSAREFGDESIDHFEMGGRFKFAEDRGMLSFAAYHSRYHDYQDSAFIGAQFTVGNAERVDLEGAELEMAYVFPSGARGNLALSYADLTYGRNTTGMCYPGRVPDGSLPGSCDLSGEQSVDAPPWSAQFGIERPFSLGGKPSSLRLDWSWTDRYQTSFSGDPRLVQGAHHDVALRFGLALSPSVELELAGENLLDETVVYFDSVLNFFNDASYQSFVALPRRFSVTLKARL